jgi:hypothetical protein
MLSFDRPSARREKAEDVQTPKRSKVWLEKFRHMARIWDRVALPKGIKAAGFEKYTRVGCREYLVKHGTYYRLDKLVSSGRASFA